MPRRREHSLLPIAELATVAPGQEGVLCLAVAANSVAAGGLAAAHRGAGGDG